MAMGTHTNRHRKRLPTGCSALVSNTNCSLPGKATAGMGRPLRGGAHGAGRVGSTPVWGRPSCIYSMHPLSLTTQPHMGEAHLSVLTPPLSTWRQGGTSSASTVASSSP